MCARARQAGERPVGAENGESAHITNPLRRETPAHLTALTAIVQIPAESTGAGGAGDLPGEIEVEQEVLAQGLFRRQVEFCYYVSQRRQAVSHRAYFCFWVGRAA